jgi:hypothetical protein
MPIRLARRGRFASARPLHLDRSIRPTSIKVIFGLIAAAIVLQTVVAIANPPENVAIDPAMSRWFNSLRQPGTQHPCCSISDCRCTGYEIHGGHFEITIDGWPYAVPDAAVLHRVENPTGEAVVCYSYSSFGLPAEPGKSRAAPQDTVEILCFIPPKAMT